MNQVYEQNQRKQKGAIVPSAEEKEPDMCAPLGSLRPPIAAHPLAPSVPTSLGGRANHLEISCSRRNREEKRRQLPRTFAKDSAGRAAHRGVA